MKQIVVVKYMDSWDPKKAHTVQDDINETLKKHPEYSMVGVTEYVPHNTKFITVYYQYDVESGYRESAR